MTEQMFSAGKVPQLSVIVPTYGEAENLPILVPQVMEVLNRAGIGAEIIVVDDNSPDDTVRVCGELAQAHPVRLIVRKDERGLSSAVIRGFREARGEILLCMDADLSHPPVAIPSLLEAVGAGGGGDFVIGSRYVSDASTDDDWGVFRWVNSKLATLLARPLTSARDPMAGFFALRRETFESAAKLSPVGYKIGLELIVKCCCKDVREVPIHFSDRMHGESKLTLKEQWNYIIHLKRLYEFRLGRLARPVQFVLVGSSGMVIDLTAYAALLGVLPMESARAVAIPIAMTWNFWLNRRLTFSYARTGSLPVQYVRFCASCLLGAFVNWTVSTQLAERVNFFAEREVLAAVFGVVTGTMFNYVLSVRFVFRSRSARTSAEQLRETSR